MGKLPFFPCNLGGTNRLSGQFTKKSCKGKRGDIQKASLISMWSSLIIGISDDSFCPAPISSIHVYVNEFREFWCQTDSVVITKSVVMV